MRYSYLNNSHLFLGSHPLRCCAAVATFVCLRLWPRRGLLRCVVCLQRRIAATFEQLGPGTYHSVHLRYSVGTPQCV